MKPINPKILLVAVVVLALPCAWAWQGRPDNTPPNHIGYHEVKTDASRRIVPWYGSGPSEAYDHMVRLVFHFWMTHAEMPERGPVLSPAPGLEARAGRSLADSAAIRSRWRSPRGICSTAISAIRRIVDNMKLMADYWLGARNQPVRISVAQSPISRTISMFTPASTTETCAAAREFSNPIKPAVSPPN